MPPSSDLPSTQREYPSVCQAGPWIIASNGAGSVQLLALDMASRAATVAGSIHLGDDEGLASAPPVLLAARVAADARSVLCLAYRMRENSPEEGAQGLATGDGSPRQRVAFFLTFFAVGIPEGPGPVGDLPVEILATVTGQSAPRMVAIEPDGEGFLVVSDQPYEAVQRGRDVTMVDAPAPATDPASPSYMWMQTSEDLTVTIPLTRGVQKQSISCSYTRSSVRLNVTDHADITALFAAPLFAGIDPAECVWTLEADGVLTLELQKEHVGTRWTHLFENDDGVAEAVDPSELAEFRERLEKYTSDRVEPGPENGGAEYAMQESVTDRSEPVDFEGHEAAISRFSRRAGEASSRVVASAGIEWLCPVFNLPDPATTPSTTTCALASPPAPLVAICAKFDVDGIVFDLFPRLENPTHSGTFDAFGFVQASKRDKRFMVVTAERSFALIVESKRHIFAYRRAPSGGPYADQYVVDLAGREEGAEVVGVQQVGPGKVAVLTETGVALLNLDRHGSVSTHE
ncbi:hypothetical protein BDK51DRAFT_47492 [Blyttiomyces helicus]|uniref:NudC domain-containing protein 1 n=1 Tax=Blyttiomyces helicus TaxID=388810 RepID=A0A4P9WIF8_9FUNG|nr:hypothetical protein BDK51DRAFT_47492 [Blyttiomyces helicus]|eukprot:RKO91785.1 hypothetical protein BDK51DRAFT_47492 [Blyttiomyces helicus]